MLLHDGREASLLRRLAVEGYAAAIDEQVHTARKSTDYSWNVDDRLDPEALRSLRALSSLLAE